MGATIVFDVETVGAITADQAEAIAEMAAAKGEEPQKFAALCPPLARVVCIGFEDPDTGRKAVLSALDPAEERVLLVKANEIIAKAAQLVTFRGRAFDLPVLIHRSLANGVRPSSSLVRAAREYRYKPNLHIDLWDQFTFYGAGSGTLRAFCLGYGLPDPKAGGDGGDVATLVAEGRKVELETYCQGDVASTVALFKRWRDQVGVAA